MPLMADPRRPPLILSRALIPLSTAADCSRANNLPIFFTNSKEWRTDSQWNFLSFFAFFSFFLQLIPPNWKMTTKTTLRLLLILLLLLVVVVWFCHLAVVDGVLGGWGTHSHPGDKGTLLYISRTSLLCVSVHLISARPVVSRSRSETCPWNWM